MGRGFKTQIRSAWDQPLNDVACINCGQCIAACPTGALYEKDSTKAVWDLLADDTKKVGVQTAPAVRAALGLPVEEMHDPVYQGHWSIVMLHAERSGAFRKLWIAEDARPSVVEEDLWVGPGDPVEAFSGASKAVGSLVMNWPTEEERDARMADVTAWVQVLTE